MSKREFRHHDRALCSAWLLILTIGLAVATSLLADDCPKCGCPICNCHDRKYAHRLYSLQARSSVETALSAQAVAGRVYEQTVWNNAFDENSAVLHTSGQAFLQRLARQAPGQSLDVYLQTTRDIAFTPDDLPGFVEKCDALNRLRGRAVYDYLTIVLRQPPPVMYVHDPQPIGMWAYEASPAYQAIRLSPRGTLDASSLTGIEGRIDFAATSGDPVELDNPAVGGSAAVPELPLFDAASGGGVPFETESLDSAVIDTTGDLGVVCPGE